MKLRELVIDAPYTKDPEAIAFGMIRSNEVVSISRARFKHDVDSLSAYLNHYEVHGNIGILGRDDYEWVVAHLSVASDIGVAVALDKGLSSRELAEHLSRVDSHFLLYTKEYSETAHEIQKSSNCTILSIEDALNVDSHCMSFPQISKRSDDVCSIFFTSGTTSADKAVMLTEQNIVEEVLALVERHPETHDDVFLSMLPLHHTFSYVTSVLVQLAYGVKTCFMPDLKRMPKWFRTFNPTKACTVPDILNILHRSLCAMNLSVSEVFGNRIKWFCVGGAPCSVELQQKYNDIGIQLLEGYGITECSPVISLNPPDKVKRGSVGTPLSCNEVKLIDSEIAVRGTNVFIGYYNDPIATSEAFTENGWYKTGDLGYIDSEGYIYITGRKKNLIILSNGENISPEELEHLLYQIDYVDECLVYAKSDIIRAEIVANADWLNRNASAAQSLLEEDVAQINRTLPLKKHIQEISLRKTPFEKTSTNKIKRNKKEN